MPGRRRGVTCCWRWDVELEWIATDPDSRTLSYTEQRSTVDDYLSRIETLRALGEGFSQVHWADRDYPLVTLRFRNAFGVVDHFTDDDKVYLLVGDGVIANDETVLVPGIQGDSWFTGAFVMTADYAWDVVKAFIRSGSVEDLGEWFEL
jgi:hypothetical protein